MTGVIPMTGLVLKATPLIAMVRPWLEALGLRLSRAIDHFAEARMRGALPARLLQAQLEAAASSSTVPSQISAEVPGRRWTTMHHPMMN
jgi:hypothetical protein